MPMIRVDHPTEQATRHFSNISLAFDREALGWLIGIHIIFETENERNTLVTANVPTNINSKKRFYKIKGNKTYNIKNKTNWYKEIVFYLPITFKSHLACALDVLQTNWLSDLVIPFIVRLEV